MEDGVDEAKNFFRCIVMLVVSVDEVAKLGGEVFDFVGSVSV